jgi:molybdopterin synthase catalytic subunit
MPPGDDPQIIDRYVSYAAMVLQLAWPAFIFAAAAAVTYQSLASVPELLAFAVLNILITLFVMRRMAAILLVKGQDPSWQFMAVLGMIGLLVVLALRNTHQTGTTGGFEVMNVSNNPIPDAQTADRAVLDIIHISREPISAARCIGHVTDPAAGGIAVFIGATRADQAPDPKRQLVALDYEAYLEMANKQMHDIADSARKQWPIVRLVIAHRIGRVPLSQPSVIIAVATPHRSDAFAACRFIIDTLKSSAAVWKKEVWSDGTSTWVEPAEAPVREGSA